MTVMNLEVLVERLDAPCHQALEAALSVVAANGQRSVELSHWFYQLLLIKDQQWQSCASQFIHDLDSLKQDLQRHILSYEHVHANTPTLSQSIINVTCEAWLVASLECHLSSVTPSFIFLAMLSDPILRQEIINIAPTLKNIDVGELRAWCIEQGKQYAQVSSDQVDSLARNQVKSADQKYIEQFTQDLTQQANNKQLDPVIGRADEIQQMIDVLLRRKQNNPILVGEPGVGKTACVEGLAQRIAEGSVPESLKNIRLLSLDLTAMQAGASMKGEFEKRLKGLIDEVQAAVTPIILFIDEAHLLIGAGGQAGMGDAANMLKPALARGQLRTIAATTWREYKKYFETDAALVRRFQPVTVAEPTVAVATSMLRHSVDKLQNHHGIEIEDEAVQAAVELSHRYLAERKLPDKAMSLLDTACAKAVSPRQGPCFELVKLEAAMADLQIQMKALQQQDQDKQVKNSMAELNKELNDLTKQKAQLADEQSKQKQMIADLEQLIKDKANVKDFAKQKKQLLKKLDTLQKQTMLMPFAVNKRMIAKVLSAWTGIPVSNMLAAAQTKLIDLEKNCNARVFGQQAGIHTICQTLMTSGARLAKPQQPLGVFLLVGPSGVGKTETAHQVAEQLLGSADKMTVINMSAFKEAHKASTLTGSPPGYVGYGEGGVLTEAVRREPHSLVLLDEMEKAHSSIQDIFYQMLDRGIMRDSEGRDIDFRQTIIMMTSNAADQYVLDHQQAILNEEPAAIEGLHKALEKHFKPAFLGRVKVIPYVALDDSIMSRIIKYQLEQLAQRIQENYQITFAYSKAVTAQIQQACQLVQTGARQVSAIIDKHIAPLVANALLKQQLNAKSSVDELRLQVQKGSYVVDWANKAQRLA